MSRVDVRRWLAGLAVVTLGALASPGGIPVYDGVGSPDEPYRLVGTSPAPSTAMTTVRVTGGRAADVKLRSSESGPQVLLDLAAGAVHSSADEVVLTAEPLAGDTRPPRGELDGNIYRITATGDATVDPANAQGFLFLRANVMTQPDPVVVHRVAPADPWVEQKTSRAGRDVLATPLRELGDYAVVRLPGSTSIDTSGGLRLGRLLLLVGGVLVLLVITVLVLRRPSPAD